MRYVEIGVVFPLVRYVSIYVEAAGISHPTRHLIRVCASTLGTCFVRWIVTFDCGRHAERPPPHSSGPSRCNKLGIPIPRTDKSLRVSPS